VCNVASEPPDAQDFVRSLDPAYLPELTISDFEPIITSTSSTSNEEEPAASLTSRTLITSGLTDRAFRRHLYDAKRSAEEASGLQVPPASNIYEKAGLYMRLNPHSIKPETIAQLEGPRVAVLANFHAALVRLNKTFNNHRDDDASKPLPLGFAWKAATALARSLDIDVHGQGAVYGDRAHDVKEALRILVGEVDLALRDSRERSAVASRGVHEGSLFLVNRLPFFTEVRGGVFNILPYTLAPPLRCS